MKKQKIKKNRLSFFLGTGLFGLGLLGAVFHFYSASICKYLGTTQFQPNFPSIFCLIASADSGSPCVMKIFNIICHFWETADSFRRHLIFYSSELLNGDVQCLRVIIIINCLIHNLLEQLFFGFPIHFFPVRMFSFQLLCYYQSDIFSVHNASVFVLFFLIGLLKDYTLKQRFFKYKSLILLTLYQASIQQGRQITLKNMLKKCLIT